MAKKLTAAQRRVIQRELTNLPEPCKDCIGTGGSHMAPISGGLTRCHCARGKKLREIDAKYRPEPKRKPRGPEYQQRRFGDVPDWGKSAAGDHS